MSAAQSRRTSAVRETLSEQFIPDHVFVCIERGVLCCYDGVESHTFKRGACFIARKARLAKYQQQPGSGELKFITMCFEEAFLKGFQERHKPVMTKFQPAETFIRLDANLLLPGFIQSLDPYRKASGELIPAFEDVKYDELLLLLLQEWPALAGMLFNYEAPEKMALEAFMNLHYKFNVSIGRFAYLTGRSLSAFKRDFKALFHTTPAQWLVQKRLQEAHLLIQKGGKKPAEIYIDLGFEDLSHFSFAFRKHFGYTPTDAGMQKAGHAATG